MGIAADLRVSIPRRMKTASCPGSMIYVGGEEIPVLGVATGQVRLTYPARRQPR